MVKMQVLLAGNIKVLQKLIEIFLAEHIAILPWCLTDSQAIQTELEINERKFALVRPEDWQTRLRDSQIQYGKFIALDFINPINIDGFLDSPEAFLLNGLPAVVHTQGRDFNHLHDLARKSPAPWFILYPFNHGRYLENTPEVVGFLWQKLKDPCAVTTYTSLSFIASKV